MLVCGQLSFSNFKHCSKVTSNHSYNYKTSLFWRETYWVFITGHVEERPIRLQYIWRLIKVLTTFFSMFLVLVKMTSFLSSLVFYIYTTKQVSKLQKKTVWRDCILDDMALYFECRFNKNSLLRSYLRHITYW